MSAAQLDHPETMKDSLLEDLAKEWERKADNKQLYGEIYSQALKDCALELRLKSLGVARNQSKGGKARWKGTTKAQRSEAMRQAVNARWARALK